MKPNFIFIGPDKAGSTWLWKMLGQHPEVYLAKSKDIYFFDRYYAKGMIWYESHFRGAERYRAIGELSHDYLVSPEACQRIKIDLPGVKLITILRNPIERAFSEFLFIRKHGLIGAKTTFREATDKFPSIIEGGMYGRYLERYVAEFGKDRLFIGDYADIILQPAEMLKRLCFFLGVSSQFQFEALQRVILPAAIARMEWGARFVKFMAVKFRDIGFENFVSAVKQSRIIHRMLYKEYGVGERPELSFADRRWLCGIYGEDIRKLEKLLNSSFAAWLEMNDIEQTDIAGGNGP